MQEALKPMLSVLHIKLKYLDLIKAVDFIFEHLNSLYSVNLMNQNSTHIDIFSYFSLLSHNLVVTMVEMVRSVAKAVEVVG